MNILNPLESVVGLPQGVPTVNYQSAAISEKPNHSHSYVADFVGCGFWRMAWPEYIMNTTGDVACSNGMTMITAENFYVEKKIIRVQRQVSSPQLEFFKYLKKLSQKHKFKLVYEIDDVAFIEDIPLYNDGRMAYTDPTVKKNIIEMMSMADAVSVPTKYMAEYYKYKAGANTVVMPNYLPRFWIDRFYSRQKVEANYDRFRRKPRIGYAGSSTHMSRLGNIPDDFSEVKDLVLKTMDDFTWVFFGAYPKELEGYIKAKRIEYVPWVNIMQYPYMLSNLNCNFLITALLDNEFNRSKAEIKLLEGSAFGIPVICKDIEPYKGALLKYSNPDEIADHVKELTKSKNKYMSYSDESRKMLNSWWLEDNINVWKNFYFG